MEESSELVCEEEREESPGRREGSATGTRQTVRIIGHSPSDRLLPFSRIKLRIKNVKPRVPSWPSAFCQSRRAPIDAVPEPEGSSALVKEAAATAAFGSAIVLMTTCGSMERTTQLLLEGPAEDRRKK
jgi:hypothetical protein